MIIGNCQGGWATALVAASNPHVTGPIVLNGAPMSYWAGTRGKDPLRYLGGLAFGAVPALLASDLGNGKFDGADLVQNFEKMNPGNTKWMKYYTVFANVDTEGPRFKGFEKWWSSFYFMNEAEIRWIVENLFIGNKLQRGLAVLGHHGTVDLREIRAPIIVFASKGDDITPPPQALNWIAEVYGDEREIRARGQTIIYIVHEEIGHLGIFVSAKVARKEHDRIVTTLDAVEALAPGLYEMHIEKIVGEGGEPQYVAGFEERTIADLRVYDDGEDDDAPFAVVARLSEFWVDLYEMTMRPLVQAMATPVSADARVKAHPLRVRRVALSDKNPAMLPIAPLAEAVRAARKPAPPSNPFFKTEKLFAGMIAQTMDFWRDVKSATDELTFFSIYANPLVAGLARRESAEPNIGLDATLRELPAVREAVRTIAQGGYVEAVLRMLILMARSRGEVRQSRLERSNAILNSAEPFASLGVEARSRLIHQQTLIIDFEPEQAIADPAGPAAAIRRSRTGDRPSRADCRRSGRNERTDRPDARASQVGAGRFRAARACGSPAHFCERGLLMIHASRLFSDLAVGDVATIKRVVAPDDLYVFAHVSGNFNPANLPGTAHDDDDMAATAPSMWIGSLFSAVLGNLLPGPGTMYEAQTLRFHARAHVGDLLTITVRVVELRAPGTVVLETKVERDGNSIANDGAAEVFAPDDAGGV